VGAKLTDTGTDFDVPFGNGSFAELESTCLNFNATSSTYIDAKQVVEEAKKNDATLVSITSTVCWVALLGFMVSLLA
jgi:hypothetical protein